MKLLFVGNLHPNRKLPAWRKNLPLELVQGDDPVTTLDIQAWILETKAPVVPLRSADSNFGQLIGRVKTGGGVSHSSRRDPALRRLTL